MRDPLAQLAQAVADRTPIDWPALRSRRIPGTPDGLVSALQSIDRLASIGDELRPRTPTVRRSRAARIVERGLRALQAPGSLAFASLGGALGLAAHLHRHRAQSLATLAGDPWLVTLLSLTAAPLVALVLRTAWARVCMRGRALDGEDAQAALFRAREKLRRATSIEEALDLLALEIEESFGTRCRILTSGPDGYAPAAGRARPILHESALASLALSEGPFLVDPASPRSLFPWLPPSERCLVMEAGLAVILPVPSPAGSPLALVALEPAPRPYSAGDFRVLCALASGCGMAIGSIAAQRRVPTHGATDPEPAGECRACGLMHLRSSGACACGGVLEEARLPYVLHGKFRLVRRLGSGAMGVVYEAEDLDLGRSVALKTLPRVTPDLALRLRQEARSMARLLHPRLATIFGCETWRGVPVLVLEHLAGTLSSRLGTPWPVGEALAIGAAAAEGLVAMHGQGWLHRDVKPSNVGFTHDGGVKLLDLGIARLLERPASALSWDDASEADGGLAATGHQSHRLVGTPLYCSPERLEGAPARPADDVWALSLLVYELLAGAHPWRKGPGCVQLARPIPDLREIRAEVPRDVAVFLGAYLDAAATERPGSAQAFRSGLLEFLAGARFARPESA